MRMGSVYPTDNMRMVYVSYRYNFIRMFSVFIRINICKTFMCIKKIPLFYYCNFILKTPRMSQFDHFLFYVHTFYIFIIFIRIRYAIIRIFIRIKYVSYASHSYTMRILSVWYTHLIRIFIRIYMDNIASGVNSGGFRGNKNPRKFLNKTLKISKN